VIPLSGKVTGRASGPSRSRVDDGGGLQYVSRKIDRVFRFSRRGEYIGERGAVMRWARGPHLLTSGGGRAASGCGPGGHTTWWRGQGLGRATLWRLAPGPPPSRLWTPSRVGKNRNFGFCFVQFREYYLCSFSETQKQQKMGNWHCGISLVG
jgi:hypothetical protein